MSVNDNNISIPADTSNCSGAASVATGPGGGWVYPIPITSVPQTFNTGGSGSGWITTGHVFNWTNNPLFVPAEQIESQPVEAPKATCKDGCACKKCKEFYPFAEPNQDDGTLICFACRKGF